MKVALFNLMLFLVMSAIVTQDASIQKPKEQENIYEYTQDNLPEIWFFPKEKARWDGTKITSKQWHMLTKVQKISFISEYLDEFEKKFYVKIEEIDPWRYLIALDNSADDCKEDCLKKPMTDFIDELLMIDGIMKDTVIVK